MGNRVEHEQQPPQRAVQTEPPTPAEPENQPGAQFTSAGTIPPVNTHAEHPGASASDRGYGGTGVTLTAPSPLRVKASPGLNVRSSPDKGDNIVGGLQHGEQVQGVKSEGDWINVAFHGAPAYVHHGFVELLPATPTMHADSSGGTVPGAAHADVKPKPPTAAPAHADPAATEVTHAPKNKAPNSLEGYQHLAGGELLTATPTTTQHEADILAALRKDHRKLDPVYLLGLQNKLQVKDATGAMNTETLRALEKLHPHITAELILEGSILQGILPGTPTTDLGDGWGGGAHGATGKLAEGESKADGMARAAGFASYAQMSGHFTKVSFLGINMGRGMPHLAQRVDLASKFVMQRHNNNVDEARKALGLDDATVTRGVAAYSASAPEIEQFGFGNEGALGPHMHSAGLAIDIKPATNPWVFSGENNAAGGTNDIMNRHLKWASQMFGGEALTNMNMNEWSKQMSTEELWAKVDRASHAFHEYLDFCVNGKDEEIIDKFVSLGYSKSEAKDHLASMRRFGKQGDSVTGGIRYWFDNLHRQKAQGLTDHTMELVVALRDVAGLTWGGSEMSGVENGDFMHFDCRNDPMGKAVVTFAQNNNVAPATKPAADKHEQDEHTKNPHK